MREIKLTKGQVTQVDDHWFPILSADKWCASISCGRIYATRRVVVDGRRTTVSMHRVIMNAKAGEEIDHREGIGLNNQEHNLRRATRSQQRANQGARRDNKCGRKGVKRHQGRWFVRITWKGTTYNLGSRDDLDEASALYAEKAKELHGEFARTA